MAEKNFTVEKIWRSDRDGTLISWKGLGLNDTGKPYPCWCHSDKSIQIVGTFGSGGKCVIEGSNMDITPIWATLADPQGNLLEVIAAKIEAILENPYQIRPNITAGDGTTNLDIYMIMK
jgi:hypothetical protein